MFRSSLERSWQVRWLRSFCSVGSFPNLPDHDFNRPMTSQPQVITLNDSSAVNRPNFLKATSIGKFGGSDGTRTRGLLRHRQLAETVDMGTV